MIIDLNGTADLADLRIVDIRWNSSGSRENCKCLLQVASKVFSFCQNSPVIVSTHFTGGC